MINKNKSQQTKGVAVIALCMAALLALTDLALYLFCIDRMFLFGVIVLSLLIPTGIISETLESMKQKKPNNK